MRRTTLIFAFVLSLGLAVPAIAQDDATGGTDLYTVDLETGELTSVGAIGDGVTVTGFALDTTADPVGPAWAVTADGRLLGFDVATPDTLDVELALSGPAEGEVMVGIDIRPASGELIALSNLSVLYTVDTETGEATALGETLDPALEAETLGFDFNPTVDRIRVDVSTTQNLRLNPETGAVGVNPDTDEPTIDGNTAFAAGDDNEGSTPRVVAAGYTNSVADAEETALYVLDAETQTLALQNPPNDGTLNTIAPLSVEITDWTGFDIAPSGEAFVTIPADAGMGMGVATPMATPVG